MLFLDRPSAGRHLAATLQRFRGQDVVVLGLPRGGVPVASVVADELDAPLDVIVVRKLGVPSHPELAMGAIGEGGVRIVNEEVVRAANVTAAQFAEVEAREREELARRARLFRGDRERVGIADKTVIIVDDGIATGSTAWAACAVARAAGAGRVVLATPVGAQQSIEDLRRVADEVVCLETPEPFNAVGQWYRDFSATSDAEVQALLRRPAAETGRDVGIVAGSIRLPGILDRSRRFLRARRLCPRQRQQPQEPTKPVGGRVLERRRLRDLVVRSVDPGGASRPDQRVRHRAARTAAGGRHAMGCRPARGAGPSARLLRSEHGRSSGAVGREPSRISK